MWRVEPWSEVSKHFVICRYAVIHLLSFLFGSVFFSVMLHVVNKVSNTEYFNVSGMVRRDQLEMHVDIKRGPLS